MDPFTKEFDNKLTIKKEYNDKIEAVIKIYENKLKAELNKNK